MAARVGLSLDLEPASSALLFRDWTPTKPALPERAVTGAAASVKPPEPLPPPLMQSKSAAALEESMLRSSQFFAYRRLKELQRQHGSSVAHARSAPALPQWLPKDDVLGGAAFVGYFNAPGDRTHRQLAAEAALEARTMTRTWPRRSRRRRQRRGGRTGTSGGAARRADEPGGGQTHRAALARLGTRQSFRFGLGGSRSGSRPALGRTATWARRPAPLPVDSDSAPARGPAPGGGGGGTLRSLSRTASAPGRWGTHTTRSILSTSRSELGQLRPPDRKAFAKLYQKSRDLQTNIPDPGSEEAALAEAVAGAETTGELVAARFVNKCSEMRLTPMAIAVNLERGSAASPPLSVAAAGAGAVAGQPGTASPPASLSAPASRTRITLDLSHFSLGDAMSRAVAHSVQDGAAKVEELRLRENRIGTEGSVAIAEARPPPPAPTPPLGMPRQHRPVNETGALALARALLQNGTLQELDLSWNKIRGRAAAALLASLGSNEGLTSLNLAWNGLSDVEGQALGPALRDNEALQSLDLSHNRLQGRSCAALRHAFAANESLVELNLAANPIGPEGAKQLILAMEADAADGIERRLDLTDCDLNLGEDLLIGTSAASAHAPPLPARARRRFDPNEPAGLYVLELADPYERAVAVDLLQVRDYIRSS
eukprot:tig00001327_g8254.t1